MIPPNPLYDVLIIGGGPAGLSAALFLGRCCRKVALCDNGLPRNRFSKHMHGFLTRDGIPPREFLEIGRVELGRYKNVTFVRGEAVETKQTGKIFTVRLKSGETFTGRKLVLATGVKDDLPDIGGIEEYFGKSVFLCPYCDGWEVRDRAVAVYGQAERGPAFTVTLRQWTKDLILCTDGPIGGSAEDRDKLKAAGVQVIEDPIVRLHGENGYLTEIEFQNGRRVRRSFLFFNSPMRQQCVLAQTMGCRLTAKGEVETDHCGATSVSGLYIAGDASRDLKMAIVAAAEGAKAGFAINKELIMEETAL